MEYTRHHFPKSHKRWCSPQMRYRSLISPVLGMHLAWDSSYRSKQAITLISGLLHATWVSRTQGKAGDWETEEYEGQCMRWMKKSCYIYPGKHNSSLFFHFLDDTNTVIYPTKLWALNKSQIKTIIPPGSLPPRWKIKGFYRGQFNPAKIQTNSQDPASILRSITTESLPLE